MLARADSGSVPITSIETETPGILANTEGLLPAYLARLRTGASFPSVNKTNKAVSNARKRLKMSQNNGW